MADSKNYYEILGVPSNATPDEIKLEYHRLALKKHPDIPGTGNETEFRLINEAYEMIRDEARRARYDETRDREQRPHIDRDRIRKKYGESETKHGKIDKFL